MNKQFNIAILKGDGIGPEIVNQGINVLNAISKKYNHKFILKEALIGGAALEKTGMPLPDETLSICKSSDAVLLGAVGSPKYDTIDPALRPEQALLKIRKELNLFANLRPAIVFDELASASTLKESVVKNADIMIVRELTGGLYFGQPRGITSNDKEKKAFNTMVYSDYEIERIANVAFETALKRQKRLCSVDKANVLETSRLWRSIVEKVSINYPDVELSHMYVDNAAMQLIKDPKQFDVMLTENLFGDILSDEASMITGSLGMLASASLSNTDPAMYEPSHGSAPDIAGQNKANPIATIMSVAMLLKYSFNMIEESNLIENSVKATLKAGFRTSDIHSKDLILVGTKEMGELISNEILKS